MKNYLLLALFISACGSPPNSVAGSAAVQNTSEKGVQFKKAALTLGSAHLNVEIADTEDRRERGLMGRTSLKDSEGMIFIFDMATQQGFWMKDTLIPLSIGFFSPSGKLF